MNSLLQKSREKREKIWTFPGARILGEEDREFYYEVVRKTGERFGRNSKAYNIITHRIKTGEVIGCHFFWVTNLNRYLPKGQKIISLDDIELIDSFDPTFFHGIVTNVPEIILRTGHTEFSPMRPMLQDLVKQVRGEGYEFSPENPLRISGLELVENKDTSQSYGLLLRINENTILKNDKRFFYSDSHRNRDREIVFGRKTKLLRSNKKEGLSNIFLDLFGDLDLTGDYMAYSDDNCRTVIKFTEDSIWKKNIDEWELNHYEIPETKRKIKNLPNSDTTMYREEFRRKYLITQERVETRWRNNLTTEIETEEGIVYRIEDNDENIWMTKRIKIEDLEDTKQQVIRSLEEYYLEKKEGFGSIVSLPDSNDEASKLLEEKGLAYFREHVEKPGAYIPQHYSHFN